METRYEAVKRHVLGTIEAGDYGAGDKLPSENQLVQTLGVSRMTVNRALRELTDQGHIVRRAGMGSFVAGQRMRGHAADIISIRDELARRGEAWSAVVSTLEKREEQGDIALEFGQTCAVDLFHMLILHSGDKRPIELEERWVNPVVVPHMLDQDFSRITTTEYLLAAAPLLRAEHIVRAVAPSYGEARLLDVSENTPCLEITRRTWTGDRVASFSKLLYPGDRYELTARFSNVGGSQK
jgi:GntR family transcriptional regulator, histidine utilization repressor